MKSTFNSGRVTRSRTGCWACKARRRRCTEEHPSCSNCLKKGVKCEYGTQLQWEDEAKAAGLAFGRAGMKDRFKKKTHEDEQINQHFLLPVTSKRALFLNTTYADISRYCQQYCNSNRIIRSEVEENKGLREENTLGRAFEWAPGPSLSIRCLPSLDQESSFIFDYYVKELCHRKVLIDDAQNPFRHLVLPLCLSSEALLHAVVAVSANDLRNRNDMGSHQYERKLLFHKTQSLRSLRILFDSFSSQPASTNETAAQDSMLLTILLHCNLEIASGSRHEWIAHLKGAKSVIDYHQSRARKSSSAFSTATLQFVHEYFSLRDVFSATASPQNSHWSLHVPLTSTSWEEKTHINVDIGLSPELLDIISSTTSLARTKFQLRRQNVSRLEQESQFLSSALALQSRLQNLQQWSSEPDPDHLIYLNAAAFKTAAYIYLRHGGFDDALNSASIQSSHLPILLDLLQHIHAKQGVKLGTAPYPMWALFIASCVVEEDDRAKAMGCFSELNLYRPVSNVPTTMQAVEAVWKCQDLRGIEEGRREALDWEEALRKLGWWMSLT